MKRCLAYALLAVFLIPMSVSAQQADRTYLTSPMAQQRHLPFSSGVVVGNTLYIAGTTGVDPSTKGPVSATEEATLVMDRIKAVVQQAGMSMDDVVSITVYATDLANYDAFNGVYQTYFHNHFPARAFVGVSTLLFGARYELAGIAVRSAKR